MNIDLSFTCDPQWIKEREALWRQWEVEIKANLRKKELADRKQYFLTGCEGDLFTGDAGKLDYFPLQAPEGWDYVFENFIQEPKSFLSFFQTMLQNRSYIAHMAPYELQKWDYFLGKAYEPAITSRVPIAGTGQKVTIELDPLDVFCRIIPSIFLFLEKGLIENDSKWFQRIDYFWSLWPHITDECFTTSLRRSTEGKTAFQVKRLLGHIVRYKPDRKFPDPDKTRPNFLKQLEEKLDEMYDQLCPMLQELWDETKIEKIKFEEKQAAQKAKRAIARKKKAEEAKKAGGK